MHKNVLLLFTWGACLRVLMSPSIGTAAESKPLPFLIPANLTAVLSQALPSQHLRLARDAFLADPTLAPLLGTGAEARLDLSDIVDDDEFETLKFQHYHDNLEVVGSMAFHHWDGNGESSHHEVTPVTISATPEVEEGTAVAIARSTIGDRLLSRKPELKILPDEEGGAHLVWWIRLDADEGDGAHEVVVNAVSGAILADLSDEQDLRGSTRAKNLRNAESRVYSAKDQGVGIRQGLNPALPGYDPVVPGCEWVDLSDGHSLGLSSRGCPRPPAGRCQLVALAGPMTGAPLQVDAPSCREQAEDASSRNAQRNVEQVLTYYRTHHSRDSFDGKGAPVVSVVHGGIRFNNAFWDTGRNIMVYGDGDGRTFGNFSEALDIAGHEMTHGVIAHSARLLNQGESGALNEAFADFFGKMIEDKGDWQVGKGIFLRDRIHGIRDLANPQAIRAPGGGVYPAHRRELFPIEKPCDSSNDHCWVHFNSTVPGHAFYLVTKAIGKEQAEKLLYLTLTHALSPRDSIRSTSKAALLTCARLFPKSTCERVRGAFAEVGY